jgi:hypothetical protein
MVAGGKKSKRKFAKRNQFAAEIIYFSDCILEIRTPEPTGLEGLADVWVVRALYESARTWQAQNRQFSVSHSRVRVRNRVALVTDICRAAAPPLLDSEDRVQGTPS